MSSLTHRIVLVEDNAADVYLIEEALRLHAQGAQLEVLSDGEAALAYIDRLQATPGVEWPQLILIDLNLPKISGWEVLKKIRSHPTGSTVRIAILTSSSLAADRRRALELGATRYLEKPSSYSELMTLGETIGEMLAG